MDPETGSHPRWLTSGQDTWSARCAETRTPGAAGGPGKPTGSNPGRAPRSDPTKTAVSTRVFTALDAHLWKLTYKWACWTHPNKPKRWITNRYYRRFSRFRTDRWVFGNPDTGAYLPKLSWTPIVRHTLVKGGASPDDPSLAAYWARRRQKVKPPLDPSVARLLSRQDGRCSRCGENLLTPDQPPQSPEGWERWFLQVIKMAITADCLAVDGQPAAGNDTRTHLIHATCRRRQQPARRRAGGTVLELCT